MQNAFQFCRQQTSKRCDVFPCTQHNNGNQARKGGLPATWWRRASPSRSTAALSAGQQTLIKLFKSGRSAGVREGHTHAHAGHIHSWKTHNRKTNISVGTVYEAGSHFDNPIYLEATWHRVTHHFTLSALQHKGSSSSPPWWRLCVVKKKGQRLLLQTLSKLAAALPDGKWGGIVTGGFKWSFK